MAATASRPARSAAIGTKQAAGHPTEALAARAADDATPGQAASMTKPGAGQPANNSTNTVAADALTTAPRPAAGNADPQPLSASQAAAALARLQARAVALQLAAGPALGQPQLVAIAPSVPPTPFLPRWAVQVMAGPALTYRQLSAASQANNTTSTPTFTGSGNTTNTVADLERPALSGGAQVSLRRALTEHWNVSVGAGYTEFATRLALQQVHISGLVNSPDSAATSIHRRDTYRFVTLPVRLGYAWTLANRWRVGVLAGADAAFYMGGSSTEGTPCACQTQTWGGASGSPYRSFSLGASLGAEVRYRLNGRWELLAQPTATYLLSPLARPTTAYYQRHLFGGTALLGAAYILP